MPMLRVGGLSQIVDKAEIGFTLCDTRLLAKLDTCKKRLAVSEESDRL